MKRFPQASASFRRPEKSAPETVAAALIAGKVIFWGYEQDGALLGVMGIQRVRDVDLSRHAYVLPDSQGHGVGAALITHLQNLSARRMLVGTWTAAT
ncbi:MAG: GCN5-related N-acetyltransferase, partial [Gammaproteobacteria bacterium]|nr:GCN5-related N-acetyltransferase [Gammaproteobacteria bacterium]